LDASTAPGGLSHCIRLGCQMPDLTPSELSERLAWRYAVKHFDSGQRISPKVWHALEQSLILAPSSFGLQPWKFAIVTDPKIKAEMPAISWNQHQPRDCSHMVVLAARRELDQDYVDKFMHCLCETRGVAPAHLSGYRDVILHSVQASQGRHLEWNARQVYIALGQLMLAAAMLGVDSCPMEGIDAAAYDRLLGFDQTPYHTVVACALGYRSQSDKYAQAPKVRFPAAELIARYE